MNWVTIIWSMVASACLMLAALHGFIWFRDRRSWANLFFAVMALGVIGLVGGEVGTMYAATPAEYGRAIRWTHLAYAFEVVATLGFVHVYFGTGRWSLLLIALGLRVLAVVANFTTGLNLHIRSILSLQKVSFLGQQVSVLGEWKENPWLRVGQLAALALLVYVVDASVRLWRSGSHESRKRAVILGGALVFFIIYATTQAGLVAAGVVRTPFVVSLPFLAVLFAMTYEMSGDLLRAVQVGRDLQESDQRLALAVDAANLGIWIRDLARNEVWASETWRAIFGFTNSEPLELNQVLERLHPDDRDAIARTLANAASGGGDYETEFRIVRPDGDIRWIASRGRVEFDGNGKPTLIRGVSLDITDRKRSESEAQELREELSHAGRVTMLGQLASSLAHELGQPLGAILRNAEAAQMMLQSPSPDLEELRAIVSDICKDDHRAGDVINRLRSLLKRHRVESHPISVDDLVQEVVSLIRSDATARGVTLTTDMPAGLPAVRGDRVHLQQVLLNLMINGMDAIDGDPNHERCVKLHAHRDGNGMVEFAVSDSGHGVPTEQLGKLFEPFFTTKPNGMGMGLPISRTIIEAHGGRIWAERNPDRGTTLRFTLCAVDAGETA